MKFIITYPLAFDAWDRYEAGAKEFARTFKEFPPGLSNYEVWAACCFGEPTDAEKLLFRGIKTVFFPYAKHGCDIGVAQQAGNSGGSEDWIIGMTSLCYFHRAGWLVRFKEAIEKHGEGLYSASASHEGGKLHACTRAYCMPALAWQNYEHAIDTREKGQLFETGKWSITEWTKKFDAPVMQVRWDGEEPIEHARDPEHLGVFRRGSQNEMLVWDRHSRIFEEADPEEKSKLASLADGTYKAPDGEQVQVGS